MTLTPHAGLRIEDEIEEIYEDKGTNEGTSFTPSLPDPIFWETVAVQGMPELRHKIDLHVTVYDPAASPASPHHGKHVAAENLL